MNLTNDTETCWLTGFICLLICFVVMLIIGTADANERRYAHKVDELIHEKVSSFAIDIYPHSEDCRRVYHAVEEAMYLICVVDGELEVSELPPAEERSDERK